MGTLLKIILGIFSGGGTLLLSAIGTFAPGIATYFGDLWLKSKQTDAAREAAQDTQGVAVVGSWLQNVTEANRSRVEARKAEGTWGPLGIVTLAVGGIVVWVLAMFGYHVTLIVLDSSPWSVFGLFTPHVIGSWNVAPLPKPFDEIELAAINAMVSTVNALFYTAPPAAAAVAIAKIFRR